MDYIKLEKSLLTGFIGIAFCKNCNALVKTYGINKNETGLSDEEVERLILENSYDGCKSCIFSDSDRENDYFQNYLKNNKLEKIIIHKNTNVTCPKCGEELRFIETSEDCPKCGSRKLRYIGGILVD